VITSQIARNIAGRGRGAALAAAGLAAAVLAAGWSAPASAQQAATPQSAGAAQLQAAKSGAAAANAFTVVAHDGKKKMWFNIQGAPHQGLVTMHFTNHGRYAHEMSLLRLKKNVTFAQFTKAMQQPDFEKAAGKLIVNPEGEITGPDLLGAGMRETVTATLKAATYVVICFLPGPDGMPHAMMGMVGAVKVRPANGRHAAPATDGTVTLTNHGIVLPKNFTRGGTFAVKNVGTRAHDLSLVKLKGRTSLPTMFGCVGAAFGAGTMVDDCPGTFAGGVSDLAPGRTAYLRIAFGAGRYGYVSTDGNDVQKGLAGTFTVR
jgi:hypothetical protein